MRATYLGPIHAEFMQHWGLLRLASIFFIDVAAFAVLSNHYHVVLHVDRDNANKTDAKEIVRRWHKLYKPNEVSQMFIDDEHPGDLTNVARSTLSSIPGTNGFTALVGL